jgi:1-acyl-sn-glycerol-3-phosphate acyltransferase
MYELMTLTGRPYVDVYAASLKTAIVAPAPTPTTDGRAQSRTAPVGAEGAEKD